MQRGHPKPLCILFLDTKGIQWVETDASVVYGPLRTVVNILAMYKGVMEKPS